MGGGLGQLGHRGTADLDAWRGPPRTLRRAKMFEYRTSRPAATAGPARAVFTVQGGWCTEDPSSPGPGGHLQGLGKPTNLPSPLAPPQRYHRVPHGCSEARVLRHAARGPGRERSLPSKPPSGTRQAPVPVLGAPHGWKVPPSLSLDAPESSSVFSSLGPESRGRAALLAGHRPTFWPPVLLPCLA